MQKTLAKAVFTGEHLKKKGESHVTYQGDEVTLGADLYAGLKIEVEWTSYDLELVVAPEETPNGAKVFGCLIVNGNAQKIFENESKAKTNPAYSTSAGVIRSGNLIGVKDGDEYINPYKFYVRSVPTMKDKKEYHVEVQSNDYKGDYTRYHSIGGSTAVEGGATKVNDEDLPF